MMEVNTKKIAAADMFLTDDIAEVSNTTNTTDVAVDGQMGDIGMVDAGNEYIGGVVTPGIYDDISGETDTPKAGISTQVILYIVVGVCAAVGIALGIVRGIKVAKK